MKGDKSSLNKTSGYHTITGRRYGRRFAYVNFRPTLTNQARPVSQQCEECEEPGQEDVQSERATTSSTLVQGFLILSDSFVEVAESEIPESEIAPSQVTEGSSPVPSLVQSREISGINSYVEVSSKDSSENCSPSKDPVVISLKDIDYFESDSSEDEGNLVSLSNMKENPGKFPEISFKLGNEGTSFCSVQTHCYGVPPQSSGLNQGFEAVGLVPLGKYSNSEKDFGPQNFQWPTSKVEADAKKLLASCSYKRQRMNVEEVSIGSPVSTSDKLNASDGKDEVGASSKLVVRPKIRNREYLNRVNQNDALSSDEEENYSAKRWRGNLEPESSTSGGSLGSSAGKKAPRIVSDQGDKAGEREEKTSAHINAEDEILQKEQSVGDGATAWEGFENDPKSNSSVESSSECIGTCNSECADMAVSVTKPEPPSLYAEENFESSSDESYETLSVQRQRESELLLSSDSEESPEFPTREELRISLEDVELTMLPSFEAAASNIEDESGSSIIGEFWGDDDFEDDISFGDDFDLEWRLLDEYESRYGIIPTFFPEESDILNYVTVQEHLNQAMEAAVAHLEHLISEGEQTCPPASRESLNLLPEIIVKAEQMAMELCCTICCQEFVENDVITKLPCSHYFHKACLIIWLQKSATCPICRYVLALQSSGGAAAAATSFTANDEAPGSASSTVAPSDRSRTSRDPGATASGATDPGAMAPGTTASGATASGATGSEAPGSKATGNQ
ncbi:E3 ubiquitin-protein ligase Praja-2 [Tachyglossus aculeatus]|uniref:E3 ubiquitin-protein ligase Praja-2 n=1 Tax=Tachyglossus aculeatus TaxID=9261 RepID=UPI0018F53C59|nr:E3 ubiquitin-protein ligase Praja-2 [Tachyglossus aculeatus]XP_038626368.1 E3 ubiquitin-protein ligase Praja-2 [Tachyglossus aculeatus]